MIFYKCLIINYNTYYKEGEIDMNNKSNNYSPISIIDINQITRIGVDYFESTPFSKEMYKKFLNNPFESKYYSCERFISYAESSSDEYTYRKRDFIFLKSNPYKFTNQEELRCLSSMVKKGYDRINTYYKHREIGKQFGIVPTIPYKYVSKIAKKDSRGFYELGHYPQFLFSGGAIVGDDIQPAEEEFSITEEEYSFPTITENKLVTESYAVYKAMSSKGKEIKAIKYNDTWFKIEPVEWIKVEDDLVCASILFETPIHIGKNYNTSCLEESDFASSFDNTFLKWYIDNIFTEDLFKYTDCTFMKEQTLLGLNEDINSKMQEIDRLKKIRENLILQQQEQEHLIDTVHRNITSIFEDEVQSLEVPTKHR